jgi:DNA-directed RNA polymerase specialized sigma24 family protein
VGDREPADTGLSGAASAAVSGPPDKRQAVPETREQAFSAFYRSAMAPLVGFLVNRGATVHVATDIAQETMEAAFRRWHEFRDLVGLR